MYVQCPLNPQYSIIWECANFFPVEGWEEGTPLHELYIDQLYINMCNTKGLLAEGYIHNFQEPNRSAW